MPTLLVRYQTSEEGVEPVRKAVETAFTALAAEKPDIRFGYYQVGDRPEFVGLLELPDGAENPLLGLAETRELSATVARYAVGGAPVPEPVERLGSYGLKR